ncbi:MAG: hypothetical protein NC079_04830 [Clostridium sp.]|nr:hypothetical protein [Acetatifactor muris]MCM1526266.1 hypothetical protein [Bacteroides sp.]MCM1562917.1 hypothetical protein [Clostridium sp.]
MVWERTILDGVAVCAVFNVTVALLWMLVPNAFSKMLPPEIRKAAPKREKRELAILASVLYPMYILIFVYMAVSARQAGVAGFRNLFLTGYVEMFFINLGDFFGLDWFFREIVKKKGLMIPGTEQCEAWNLKKWMLTLAIPEHCVMWPLVVCPLTGLICAGIGALI